MDFAGVLWVPKKQPREVVYASIDRSVTREVERYIAAQLDRDGGYLARGASFVCAGAAAWDAATHGVQGVIQIPLAVLKAPMRAVGISTDGRTLRTDLIEAAYHVARALRFTILAPFALIGVLSPGFVKVVDDRVGATAIWEARAPAAPGLNRWVASRKVICTTAALVVCTAAAALYLYCRKGEPKPLDEPEDLARKWGQKIDDLPEDKCSGLKPVLHWTIDNPKKVALLVIGIIITPAILKGIRASIKKYQRKKTHVN